VRGRTAAATDSRGGAGFAAAPAIEDAAAVRGCTAGHAGVAPQRDTLRIAMTIGAEVRAGSGPEPGGRAPLDVVVLVASAGGLDALTKVLRELPGDFGAAVVVAQHLGGQGSTLAEILRRRIELPVDWASDGGRLRRGHVAVCRPRSVLELLPDGTCSLRESTGSLVDRPLDALLSSAGDSYGSRALGVVLSGMGRDGAAGTAALRAAGGVVIAQDESTSEQPSMPTAAAEAGADLVLPLHEIGTVVANVVAGESLPRSPDEIEAALETFAGRGEIRRLLRERDWSATPLGPVHRWPDSLRLMVRTTLDSAYPMAIWWGPELIQIYNEPWQNFLGREKHPAALGGRAQETWSEIWDEVGPMIDAVRRGESVGRADWRTLLWRDGTLEETFLTFSYSPIRDAEGCVVGVHHTGWETTEKVVAERRLQVLHALANGLAGAATPQQACERAAEALATDPDDIPFALLYLLDRGVRVARLAAAAGLEPASFAAPRLLRTGDSASPWPLAKALEGSHGDGVVLRDLDARFRGLASAAGAGAGTQPPAAAYLLPLRSEVDDDDAAVLVVGLSPHRPLDAKHRDFVQFLARQIGAGLAEAGARSRERQRLERLAALDRAKTDFFSNVSHELRTPLTLMLAPLDDLLRDGDALTPKLEQDLELIRRNATRLMRLVGTMLDFSQMEAGRLRARFEPTDIAERTREIVAQFDSAAKRIGIDLRVSLAPVPQVVWLDIEMWEKIVANLVANALKFTFEGEVEISLRELPRHVELVVRDTGVGIPEDELPHIFKRFHRVRGVRARTDEGTGIGLSLVDELVRRHLGRIRVASVAGEGTTFTVWIPFDRRPAEPGVAPDAAAPKNAVAAALAQEAMQWGDAGSSPAGDEDEALAQSLRNYAPGAHILVADDSKDMRDYLVRLLAEHWHVDTAVDGIAALEIARRRPPDLVVADVMMPGLDGFELLRELRADSHLREIPVVLVTARAEEEEAVGGLLAGADDYIVKPFSPRELVARIGGQLELARARRRAAELNAFRINLSDALRVLHDPVEIQQTACRLLVAQIGADRARFVEVDEEGGRLITMGGFAAPPMPGAFGRYRFDDFAPLGRAILEGRRLVIEDTQADPYVAQIRETLGDLQIGAQLVLPLVGDDGSKVALAVHQRAPRAWSAEEVAIAEEAAGRAWAEVVRARAEAALRESEARLAGLKEAFQAAIDGAPLEESLGVLVRTAVEQTGPGARGAFYLADSTQSELLHVVGMPASYAECVDGFRIGADSLACGLAVYTGRPIVTPDVNEAPEWEPWRWLAEEHGYRAVWSFPVETAEGRVVGTFALYFDTPREATRRDHDLAAVLTRAAGIIISRTQEAEHRARVDRRLEDQRRPKPFEGIAADADRFARSRTKDGAPEGGTSRS
jgi:signal transduction histidine kinase/chemotaxis response regulator CheB